MATKDNKEDNIIFDNLNVLKSDVNELKKELNLLNDEKERWFSEKEKYGTEIREKIRAVREAKQARDKLTASVKECKKKREAIEKGVSDIAPKLAKLREERIKVYTQHNLEGTPQLIKKKITELETKVETDVMSFEKETKIMKEIRDLKVKLRDFDVAEALNKEIKELQNSFTAKKKESNELAKLVRKEAGKSQTEHNKMIAISKEIDELKVKEEECFKKFSESKEKYLSISSQFREKISEVDSVKETIHEKKESRRKEAAKKQRETLVQMRGKVDEKLKKGMKLTTEDLKIFQNSQEKY